MSGRMKELLADRARVEYPMLLERVKDLEAELVLAVRVIDQLAEDKVRAEARVEELERELREVLGMPKRVALIVTDGDHVSGTIHGGSGPRVFSEPASEQLLADLRTLVGQRTDAWEEEEWQHAAARVREWLPKEES